jgi:hypothetical protein
VPYVITGTCTKDEHCIETCPANCIHPTKDEPDFATAAQLYVNRRNVSIVWRGHPGLPDYLDFQSGGIAAELQEFVQKKAVYFNETSRPKAHRPPSRGELSFLECGSSPPLLRDPAKRPDGVCAKSP